MPQDAAGHRKTPPDAEDPMNVKGIWHNDSEIC